MDSLGSLGPLALRNVRRLLFQNSGEKRELSSCAVSNENVRVVRTLFDRLSCVDSWDDVVDGQRQLV